MPINHTNNQDTELINISAEIRQKKTIFRSSKVHLYAVRNKRTVAKSLLKTSAHKLFIWLHTPPLKVESNYQQLFFPRQARGELTSHSSFEFWSPYFAHDVKLEALAIESFHNTVYSLKKQKFSKTSRRLHFYWKLNIHQQQLNLRKQNSLFLLLKESRITFSIFESEKVAQSLLF